MLVLTDCLGLVSLLRLVSRWLCKANQTSAILSTIKRNKRGKRRVVKLKKQNNTHEEYEGMCLCVLDLWNRVASLPAVTAVHLWPNICFVSRIPIKSWFECVGTLLSY